MELHAIGIDLGKTVFHLVGVNLRDKVVVRKKFSRKQLLHFTLVIRDNDKPLAVLLKYDHFLAMQEKILKREF